MLDPVHRFLEEPVGAGNIFAKLQSLESTPASPHETEERS